MVAARYPRSQEVSRNIFKILFRRNWINEGPCMAYTAFYFWVVSSKPAQPVKDKKCSALMAVERHMWNGFSGLYSAERDSYHLVLTDPLLAMSPQKPKNEYSGKLNYSLTPRGSPTRQGWNPLAGQCEGNLFCGSLGFILFEINKRLQASQLSVHHQWSAQCPNTNISFIVRHL